MISFRSVYISEGDCYLIFWHIETHKYENCKHVASKWSISLIKLIVLNCCQMTFYIIIWVWWWRCSYLVAWFCYQLRAMPGSGRPCLYNPTHVLNWLRIHTTFASPSPMWTCIFPSDLENDHTQTGTIPGHIYLSLDCGTVVPVAGPSDGWLTWDCVLLVWPCMFACITVDLLQYWWCSGNDEYS